MTPAGTLTGALQRGTFAPDTAARAAEVADRAERVATMERHPAGKKLAELRAVPRGPEDGPPAVRAQGAMLGLGLCLHCCGEAKAAQLDGKEADVRMAVTMAPYGLPAGVVVAVPCCWDHLAVARVSPLAVG